MIYTCTLNPSIDYLVEMDQLEIGRLNRSNHTSFFPGGKGINVSRVLKNIGIDSIALGFIGGFTGAFIRDSLTTLKINHQFIEHEAPTRINVKVKANEETEINGTGAIISEEARERLLEQVRLLHSEDYFVLAGSIPASISTDFYESLIATCRENGVQVLVDVSGPVIQKVLPYKPFLLKPNQHELGELFGVEVLTKQDAIYYGNKLVEQGVQNVIVSLGGDGAVFINHDTVAVAEVPKGTVKNSVGAGDSTVAGFLASYVQTGDVLQSFQYGLAAGSATAFSSDLCEKGLIDELLHQVKIEKVQ